MRGNTRRQESHPRGTLFGKLLVGFLLLVPLPLALFVWFAGNTVFNSLRQHSLGASAALADSIAQTMESRGRTVLVVLEIAASAPSFQKDENGRIREVMRLMVAHGPFFRSVFLLDENGRRKIDSPDSRAMIGKSYADSTIFLVPRNTRRPYISGVANPEIDGTSVVTISVPIFDPSGKVREVLAGEVYLRALAEETEEPLRSEQSGLLVLDQRRRPIRVIPPGGMRDGLEWLKLPIADLALREKTGSTEFRDPETGTTLLASFAPVEALGWVVIVTETTQHAFAEAVRLRDLLITSLILATLIWTLSVGLLARRVTRPLSRLTEAAEQIAMGDYDIKPGIHTNDELETLCEVLVQMSERIGSQVTDLAESRGRLQKVFADIGSALGQGVDFNSLLQFMIEQTAAAIGSTYAALFLLDEATDRLVVSAGYLPPEEMIPLIGHYSFPSTEGLAGWAFHHKTPIVIPDALADSRFQLVSPWRQRYPVRGLLSVPILYEGKSIGAIDCLSERVNAFDEEDVKLVQSVAGQAGVAVRNAQLYDQVKQQLRNIRAIQEVSRAASSTLRLEEVLDIGLRKAVEAMGMDTGAVFLVNRRTGQLELRATVGVEKEVLEDEAYQQEAYPVIWKIIQDQQPLVVPDIETDPLFLARPRWLKTTRELGVRSEAVVPMIIPGAAIGVVRITSRLAHDFQPSEIELAQGIANQLALSVRNAELFEGAIRAAEALRLSFYRIGRALASPPNLQRTLELISSLVAEQMGTGRSAILMQENEHLVVRAQTGLGREFQEEYHPVAGQCPPGWVVQEGRSLALENIFADPRFAAWQIGLVAGVVSFLGVPIFFHDKLVGVLAVFGDKPRVFQEDEVAVLSTFASQAAVAIENARLYEREHHVALTFQQSLLPAAPPPMEQYQVVGRYYPATHGLEVGGDFYDYTLLDGGRLSVVIADVSGKGIEAAMHTAMGKYFLRAYLAENPEPASALSRANDALTRFLPETYFITVFCGVLDPTTGEFVYASGGHEPQILLHRDGRSELLNPTGKLLGVLHGETYGANQTHLDPGGTLVLYTDGLSDARRDGEFFGIEGIERVLRAHHLDPPERIVEALRDAATEFQGSPLKDDAALVVIRRDSLLEGPSGKTSR